MTEAVPTEPADGTIYVQSFLNDLAAVRSANTVRAYGFDLHRWAAFCETLSINPLQARPRTVIEFIRAERERTYRADKTVSARTEVASQPGTLPASAFTGKLVGPGWHEEPEATMATDVQVRLSVRGRSRSRTAAVARSR